MDYKELMENLKEWHRTICKMCGDDILTCDDLCRCTGDCIVVQAITAITDLLAENQALRNAANGFKKQLESAEARAEKAEKERDIAVEQLHHCENNCDYCRNRCECDKETCFSPSPITGEPTDYWKWCGLEE